MSTFCHACIQALKSYSTGEIGRIYKENAWQEAAVTFSDYGPGARIVAFTSKGTTALCFKIHWTDIRYQYWDNHFIIVYNFLPDI